MNYYSSYIRMYISGMFPLQFKKLAHRFSLLVSIIMCIMLLVTSILTIRLYAIYCHHLRSIDHYDYNNGKYPRNCGHNESSFLILPMFGFFTMVVWVRYMY